MSGIDLAIVLAYLLLALGVGLVVRRRAGRSAQEFFLAGRSLPWWLAGTSMVATTFAADTPLAVTGLIAAGGLAANWVWWAAGIGHVVAAVLFSRLWRRLEVVTDAEILERRYSGPWAARLRWVKAGYQALLLNCLALGWVILAMRKISAAVLPGMDPEWVTFGLMGLAVVYSLMGGLRSVVLTDLAQLTLAFGGALALAWLVVQDQGGLGGMVAGLERAYPGRHEGLLSVFPRGAGSLDLKLFVTLVLVGWWKQAEGAGYIVQRLGATRSPQDAERASLWFAWLHNAIRPWPWIVVGLAALLIWPLEGGPEDREALYATLMMERLPVGLLGLAVAALLAAFMSTVDTHVNWGASYIVRDVWQRLGGAQEREVLVGRLSVAGLAGLAGLASLTMDSISEVWILVIALGSGLGSVSVARWLWWRVNVWGELAALLTSLTLGALTLFVELDKASGILLLGLGSLAVWVPVVLLTPPSPPEVLDTFYRKVRPPGLWGPVRARCAEVDEGVGVAVWGRLPLGLLAVFGSLVGLGKGLLSGPGWWALFAAGLAAFVAVMVWVPREQKAPGGEPGGLRSEEQSGQN